MNDDDYPSTNEIKPYVAVGPTPDLSITVHKATFDKTFIFFTVIFSVLLFTFVGVTIYLAFRVSAPSPVPKPATITPQAVNVNTNLGAASFMNENVTAKLIGVTNGSAFETRNLCLANKNTIWKEDHCECTSKFFGPKCDREKFDNRYFAVGNPSDNVNMEILDSIMTDGKSFNSQGGFNSCSYQCDNNSDCNGFIYKDPGMCTLFTGNIVVPENEVINYSTDKDAILYMKTSDNLKFVDRIFLAEHILYMPARYWLNKTSNKFAHITLDMMATINFCPTYINVHGNYLGIYSLYPFNYDDVNEIIEYGTSDKFYIHRTSEGAPNLPNDWKFKAPIYVLYIRN